MAHAAYTPHGSAGKLENGRKTDTAEEIEAIAKERMGEADEPPMCVLDRDKISTYLHTTQTRAS